MIKKQILLKIILSILLIILFGVVIKFFIINRTTIVRSDNIVEKNSKNILINDSLNRILITNDSIIIDLLKKHIENEKH
jgi:hypothetical protein